MTDLSKTLETASKHDDGVTSRHLTDMSSDSWLAKNVRPVTLFYILTAYLVLALLDGMGFEVAEVYITLLGQWGMLVMSFYFGGRSVEKVMDIISKNKPKEAK